MRNSIVIKFWLAMTLLALFVLLLAAFAQTSLLQKTYYQQQESMLIKVGQQLAKTVAVETDSQVVRNALSNAASASGTSIVILDTQGQIIMTQSGSNGGRMHGRGLMMSLHHKNTIQPGQVNINLQKVLKGQIDTAWGKSSLLGADVLNVGVPFYINDMVAGAVLLYAPVPDITTRLRALQQVSVYTALGGVILATVLSLFLSRSLVKPLLEMNRATRAIAQGQYGIKVAVKSNDEIGMLAASINKLSTELQEKINTLERLDQTRRDFVASVSHELRTPLTIIQGYTEALQDGLAKDEKQRSEYLAYIHEEMLRLHRIVNDLLDLRRLETGKININPRKVDINQMAEHVLEGVRPLAKVKGVYVEKKLQSSVSNIIGDEDRLAQVLFNMLDNALRVTGEGDRITIQIEEDIKTVNIKISDTGKGIAPEDIPLIWERFYKVDKSRTRVGAGTGLGLAISKKIIELHKGSIGVTSRLGEGTTFTIKLPKTNKKG